MKLSRQEMIKQIIEKRSVETQADLALALEEAGFEVTQATVSRDIKELMLIKVPDAAGNYRYAFPKEHEKLLTPGRMERTLQDCVLSVVQAENIVVVKTLPGTAQAVAYAVDYCKWPEVLGTVGGDDTIFICIDKKENADRLLRRFAAAKG